MTRMSGTAVALLAALALAACTPSAHDSRSAAPTPKGGAPAVAPPTAPSPQVAAPAVVVPDGALYVCVTERGGQRIPSVIEFPSPKVADLCRRHPEMSPCQFERNACRRTGGRVFAANGQEIDVPLELTRLLAPECLDDACDNRRNASTSRWTRSPTCARTTRAPSSTRPPPPRCRCCSSSSG